MDTFRGALAWYWLKMVAIPTTKKALKFAGNHFPERVNKVAKGIVDNRVADQIGKIVGFITSRITPTSDTAKNGLFFSLNIGNFMGENITATLLKTAQDKKSHKFSPRNIWKNVVPLQGGAQVGIGFKLSI